MGVDTKFIQHFHQERLDKSYSGGGLRQENHQHASGSWVYDPPPYWSARIFSKADLPYVPAEPRKCYREFNRIESLSYVLQKCPATHCSRHNRIAQIIAKIVAKQVYLVTVEPYIINTSG